MVNSEAQVICAHLAAAAAAEHCDKLGGEVVSYEVQNICVCASA
jgi:hypothetical protein